ncbi:MAG: efflux RND transporter periplasmic adaptor subunit [Deltaproteobacteria bacterium]|nr:efflux RND transporter periplasmic adaptor subunit [Deltaproteobacteria bacterium]
MRKKASWLKVQSPWISGPFYFVLVILWADLALTQPFPTPVEVAPVESRILKEEVDFIATLEPNITTTAGAVVSGRVVKAEVREGDRVERGKTLLMQIDRTSRQIALREAKAAVAKNREKWQRLRRGYRQEEVAQRRAESEEQKAILSRTEQDFKRGERLHRDDLISQAELERLQSDYLAAKEKHGRTLAALQMAEAGPRREEIGEAEAELREAQARYDLIEYELDRTTLRAPLTGFLVRKYVEVGTWVKTGDPVADLVDLNPVYASGPVGERKIGLLELGLKATVEVDALPGQSFEGVVTQIVPRADPQSRTFPVKIRIANENGRLKSGMLARVSVQVGKGRPGLLIPKDAVVRRGVDEVVFVVENGVARQVKVKTGRAVEQMLEIQNGDLAPQQAIVVVGNESLTNGAKVQLTNRNLQGQAPKP